VGALVMLVGCGGAAVVGALEGLDVAFDD